MTEIQKVFIYLILSTIAAFLILPILINILYKLKFRDYVVKTKNKEKNNEVFMKILGNKIGTPKSGGFIWVLLFPVISFLAYGLSDRTIILSTGIIVVGIIGMIDDHKKISSFEIDSIIRKVKFLAQWIIALFLSYFLLREINLQYSITYFILCAFMLVTYINSININDGLDGLMTGQAIWIFVGMLFITLLNQQYEFATYYAIMTGILLAFLYFNIYPARVFMGDTGSISLATVAFSLAVLSNNVLPFIIMTIPSLLIMLSSFVQILSIKFLKRKIFNIAPIHHHFQSIGWPETKVTQRFWLAQMFFVFLALALVF